MAENKQVKSKQRVADHGEVFTAERDMNDKMAFDETMNKPMNGGDE